MTAEELQEAILSYSGVHGVRVVLVGAKDLSSLSG